MMKALPSLPPGWVWARLYHLLAPVAALAVVGMLARFTPLVDLLEYMTVNLRFQARAPFDPPADSRIIFVQIDEFSLTALGKWVWPRSVEADFLNSIVNAGVNPHTVAFDIMFTEDSNKGAAPGSAVNDDAALGEAAGLLPSVITGALSIPKPADPALARYYAGRTDEALADPGPTQPLANIRGDYRQITGSDSADFPVKAIRAQSLFGFVNDNPSPVDDIRHTLPLVVRARDKVYPSLALQTLCQMLNVDADNVEVDLPARVVRLKNSSGENWTIPTNDHAEVFINYRNQERFQRVSFASLTQNLIDHAKKGEPLAPECDIANKTLLIGESATALGDMGPSPLASRSPLPFAHLNVINNVLKHDYLSFVPWYWVVAGWLVATWAMLLRLKEAPLVEAVAMPIVVVILYTVTAFGIFWLWSWQIALAWPVLGYGGVIFWGVVLRWREEQKGRQQLKQLFSSMLSPEVLNHLLDHPENVKLGGSERAVTILFSDIRDYTKFSEGLSAGEVVRQLNVYFERMVASVKECRGTFHKYIGDAIMAAWGDIEVTSLGPQKDAQNAVRSALIMRRGLRELNDERQAENLTPLRIGMGLNHGVGVLVGLIGASSQMEFTVMGDAVNTASRLEGMTKEFKTDLAISDSVRLLIGDDFLVRRLGLIVLKGKSTPTVVYEVLAEKSDLDHAKMTPETVARYEEAFDHFLARRFDQAEAGFLACEKEDPDDHCVKTYLAASREFSITPPPADWDGRIVMTTK
jgi:adenylate cyclase